MSTNYIRPSDAQCELAILGLMMTDAGVPEDINGRLLSTRERLAIALERPELPDWLTDMGRRVIDTALGIAGAVCAVPEIVKLVWDIEVTPGDRPGRRW